MLGLWMLADINSLYRSFFEIWQKLSFSKSQPFWKYRHLTLWKLANQHSIPHTFPSFPRVGHGFCASSVVGSLGPLLRWISLTDTWHIDLEPPTTAFGGQSPVSLGSISGGWWTHGWVFFRDSWWFVFLQKRVREMVKRFFGGQRWPKLRNELGGLDIITTRVDLTVFLLDLSSAISRNNTFMMEPENAMLCQKRSIFTVFACFCHVFETHTALATLDIFSKQLTQFFLETFPSAEVTRLASLCQRLPLGNGRCARALTTVSPWATRSGPYAQVQINGITNRHRFIIDGFL